MTEKHLTNTRFDEFELHPSLLAGLADAGFTYCTPIQEASLPLIVKGKDIAGQAQTGTGKTAAFLVGGLQYLILHPAPPERRPNQPRMLILAPTRELAVQIHKDAMLLAKHTDFRFGLVYGGTGYEKQRNEVEAGVDVLIGTPGRLIDYFKQRVFDLNRAQAVVLDEADRMFDLGFIKDIRFLLRRMPPPEKRLGMLFSATLSFRVSELAYEHMNNPQSVKIETDRVTAEKVEQRCYMTANEEKIPLLIGLMRHMDPTRSIVFVNTKREADRVWGYLEGNGLHAAILSGDVPQNKRLALLKSFQEGELPVLVATDVAARGLHIPDVSHVFNYDLPEDAEDYVHRIGRTARAGASGDAISFVCERFAFSLPDIEAFIGHKLPMESVTAELLADVPHGSRMPSPERKPRDKGGRRDKSSSRPCGEGRSGKSGDGPPKQPRRRRRKPAADSPAGG